MIESLIELDQQLFLWLNGLHADWLDPIMLFITKRNPWIPLYALILFLVIRKLKWQSWSMILAFALLITLADQAASGFFKPFFERLRPCHDPAIQGLVHMVKGCGGQYGFASSHASNTFALAFFLWFIYRNSYAKIMIAWAVVVSYSRIYVGVHYPGDIIMGAILGVLAAIVTFQLYKRIFPNHLEKIHGIV
ncbi:phosphatase PAP2 family protein [Marivirga harenae]|uniref:phosphatase PAP2 family protein n=1 Tax=Marivirga harenae TaxID=2010992 RepID=UPI0026DF51BB|nr:phosphatase PAP2 family protein [Marivirga harenae]WKV10706.1 phosphatase PAP2 family protein [Marivirga harenae]|tara:strand:+ start:88031 stop:88606 length:576 start_codon:yes stop_codon:yes gene_type:complete